MKLHQTLLAATMLVAVAGCGKKRPAQLPPPPLQDSATGTDQGATGPQTDANGNVIPGSDADFRRSVSANTVLFGLDQYDIDATARAILDSQAEWLARNPRVRVTIEGHADERGTREYNLALGDQRANAAKNYLAARGVDAARMTTISYGKERPAALGSDEDSYAQNRRAVTVVPN
ncbi:peptidoglycan-associated lipoprotein Pal [Sphingomonas sp.]|jgi:peptidoglycan-associated lipoprotein|uniref:peptidoglycan-associated lipoprotein Pal n=1 Tax=Sphingomonas sp. TaxID=28214 RepID=UPI002D802E30|nr:peptidoglycan-associated lipoprotein Pal [Sphingomonas sp.]HEU0045722.1 peptidoglycan-associated lipoprotein Pal [Sphingomonas sp.]